MQDGQQTGRWAILVRHPEFLTQVVSEETDPEGDSHFDHTFCLFPNRDGGPHEPSIRYWDSCDEAETFAAVLREKGLRVWGNLYRFDAIPEVLRAVLAIPEEPPR